ncbi:hypothetical protein HanIR_Chr05g0248021 [Helianthus annuus]|nr:hypothetical protein HanIR_Chr05g0248021 [Helianthus annuus]
MSFIAASFCDSLHGNLKKINGAFDMKTTNSKPTKIRKAITNCYTKIECRRLPFRLFLMTLEWFDILLRYGLVG